MLIHTDSFETEAIALLRLHYMVEDSNFCLAHLRHPCYRYTNHVRTNEMHDGTKPLNRCAHS